MASITLTALKLAQTFNRATGEVMNLQSRPGEVLLELPGTDTSLSHRSAAWNWVNYRLSPAMLF